MPKISKRTAIYYQLSLPQGSLDNGSYSQISDMTNIRSFVSSLQAIYATLPGLDKGKTEKIKIAWGEENKTNKVKKVLPHLYGRTRSANIIVTV